MSECVSCLHEYATMSRRQPGLCTECYRDYHRLTLRKARALTVCPQCREEALLLPNQLLCPGCALKGSTTPRVQRTDEVDDFILDRVEGGMGIVAELVRETVAKFGCGHMTPRRAITRMIRERAVYTERVGKRVRLMLS